MKLLPRYLIPKGWVSKMKLRGGMLEGCGQIENEIRSCKMKMKLPLLKMKLQRRRNKYGGTHYSIFAAFSILSHYSII